MRRATDEMLGAWVDFCEHRPWPVLIAVLAISVVGAVVVWRFAGIDSDLGKLIRPSAEVAWFRHDEAYKRAFPELQQTAVVVVSGADPGLVDSAGRDLTEALRGSKAFDFVFAPALDEFLRAHRAYYLDRADLADWLAGVRYDYGALLRVAESADLANAAFTLADHLQANDGLRWPSVLATLADSFASDQPPGAERFSVGLEAYPHLTPPGAGPHYLLIMLKGPQRLHERLPNAELVQRIRTLLRSIQLPPGVEVRLTGEIPLADEEIGAAMDGIAVAGTLSLLLLGVILGFGVRSLRVILVIFALLGIGVLWTLAFATVAVGSLNTLALIFVVMFFGLGVDFAVHFALKMRESRRRVDRDDVAEVEAAREVGPALLLCMVTSCVAFLSFVPTDYRGLAELGIICAGGMVIALLLTLTVIPASFVLLRIPVEPTGDRLTWLHRLPVPSGWILAGTVALALVAALLARELTFDYSVLAMRDETTEAMSTLLELQKNGIATDYSIVVLADDAGAAHSLKTALLGLPEVGTVTIPEDLVPSDQSAKRGQLADVASLLDAIDGVQPGELGDSLAEAVAYLETARGSVAADDRVRYEALLRGLARLIDEPGARAQADRAFQAALDRELHTLRQLLHARPFSLQDLPADLRARLVDPAGRQLVSVQPGAPVASRAATEAFIDAVASVTPNYAGRAVVEWGVGEVAVRAFLQAVSLAVVCIGVVLVLYFRGLLLPLAVLAPLGLTTLFTFALMVLFGMNLNMANILVIPLIFGLGVDAGIHVVHRFQRTGSVSAVLASSTGKAVLISALTTIGTFFSLSFSPHKGAASVGLLLTLAITVMLLVTFFVLPALLDVMTRARRVSRASRCG